ncbi:MAG: hypothetical protein E7460_02485 [Ruminococcaceae bacterium]|nr:hypothetical protein [Oscillospiraceae bacterium]
MEYRTEAVDKLIDCYDRGISPFSVYDGNEIDRLVSDPDGQIRAWLAKALVSDFGNPDSLKYLCRLASDPESDVRVEAIDSLSEYICEDSLRVLTGALNDPDSLVRGYAAFGVSNVGKVISPSESSGALLSLECKEKDEFVLVGIYEGLYMLGSESYLDRLISLFSSDDYHIQCAVIHSLENVLSERNAEQIGSFLDETDIAEYPVAVSCAVEELRKTLTGIGR